MAYISTFLEVHTELPGDMLESSSLPKAVPHNQKSKLKLRRWPLRHQGSEIELQVLGLSEGMLMYTTVAFALCSTVLGGSSDACRHYYSSTSLPTNFFISRA